MSWTRCKYCRKLVEIAKHERHQEVVCPHCISSFVAKGKVPDEEVAKELEAPRHPPVTPRQVLLFVLALLMLAAAVALGVRQLTRDRRSMDGLVGYLESLGMAPRRAEPEPSVIDGRHLPMRRFVVDPRVRALCDLLVFQGAGNKAVVLRHGWPLAAAPAGFGTQTVALGTGGGTANGQKVLTPLEERQHAAALKAVHRLTGYAFNYKHIKLHGQMEPDSTDAMEHYTLALDDWRVDVVCRRSSARGTRRFGPYTMELTLRHASWEDGNGTANGGNHQGTEAPRTAESRERQRNGENYERREKGGRQRNGERREPPRHGGTKNGGKQGTTTERLELRKTRKGRTATERRTVTE